MESVISVLSIISCAASLGGLIIQFFGKKGKIRIILILIFIAAVGFSFYVLFIPGNRVMENVESKIRYYSKTHKDDVLVQESSFSFSGKGPYSIQFDEPYLEKPDKLYILNPHGYDELEVPKVSKVTNHYFEVERRGSSGTTITPRFLQKFKWLAEGRPLTKSQ